MKPLELFRRKKSGQIVLSYSLASYALKYNMFLSVIGAGQHPRKHQIVIRSSIPCKTAYSN